MAEGASNQAPTATAKSGRKRKWLAGAVLAIVALLALVFVVLNSSIGKRFVVDQIASVAPASGLRFEVGRIDGDLFGEATLHDVTLYDPGGEFLTIPVVELDWNPLAWLTSGLDVEKLVARRGTLSRLPELLPGDPDAPILPDFDIKIGRFEIDQLTIAEGIVGDASPVVDLTAEADIRDGRVFLKAQGDLGEQDRLFALIDAEPDGDAFDIDLDYRAPAGGVLAGLIGAQDGYTARIKGDGTWSRWTGHALVRREEERFAGFRVTNRSGKFGLLGQLNTGEFVTGISARALGQTVSLQAGGTLEDSVFDGVIDLIGSGIRAEGEGAVDLASNAFDEFAVGARVRDPAVLSDGFLLEDTQLTATLDGEFRDLTIDHRLSVGQAVAGETRLTGIVQEAAATFDGTRWMLPLDATVEQVETGAAIVDPKLVRGTLAGSLVFSGTQLLADDLRLVFPDATANLALRGDVRAGSYRLTGPVDVRGLMLENIGAVSGNAKIDLDVRDTGLWALKTGFSARIPQVSNDTLANLAGDSITTKGAISIGSNSPLDFRNVALNADKLALNMNGRVTQGTTSLTGDGSHVDYGDFTVEASLGDSGPTASLVFANPLPAAGLRDVRVAISPNENGFDIDTDGQSTLGEFDGRLALIAPESGPTRIDIETLNVWKTSVAGRLTLADGGVDGSLRLNGGGLGGRVGLAARNGGQGFAFDLDADRAQFGGATPISVARANLEGRGFLIDGNSTIRAEMTGEGLAYGTLFIGRFAARSELENGTGFANAAISGRRGSRFALQVNSQIAPERVAIAARGQYAGEDIRMPRRAIISKQTDGGWQLARSLVQYGEGGMLVSGEFGGGRTALDMSLDKMPLSLVDLTVSDMGLGGSVSGQVDFTTNRSGVPVGSARVQVDDLTRSGLLLSSRPIDLALVSRLTSNTLEARAVLQEGGARRGRLQARISGLPQSGGLASRLRNGNLFAQLRFNGPASSLWRLAAIEAFDLTGPVSVAANARGTLANPSVRGSIASDSLRVRSALSGTDIRNVTARGSFAGSRLRLTHFSGSTANGGTVSGSGTVDLEDLGPKGPRLDIKVAASNARLLNANGIDATITGPLRIVSDGNGGTIAGRVAINRASWRLGTAAEDMALPSIKTREINVPADIAPRRQRFRPWRYLIDARADSRVDVDGMGLDSEWRANIQLRGTTEDPRIGGQARVVRGYYSFAGTRFELTRGRINFDASVPIDPRVDIIAETQQNGIDVAVSVQGNAQTPEITFSSTPALPEEEILARLLFGGSITDLSATDAVQLGAALASLRGGSGMDPINQLRSAIGLDRLRIVGADPALGRGTGVAVGKNIGRRFYVEIVTDGRGYSATEAEFRVTSWLSLLSSVSTIGRESVAVEVSRDY